MEPYKVVAAHWDCFGASVDLHTWYGFASQIVPNREYVAVLEETDASGHSSTLEVYASSGALVRSSGALGEVIGGQTGEFLWPPWIAYPEYGLGDIFWRQTGQPYFRWFGNPTTIHSMKPSSRNTSSAGCC